MEHSLTAKVGYKFWFNRGLNPYFNGTLSDCNAKTYHYG